VPVVGGLWQLFERSVVLVVPGLVGEGQGWIWVSADLDSVFPISLLCMPR